MTRTIKKRMVLQLTLVFTLLSSIITNPAYSSSQESFFDSFVTEWFRLDPLRASLLDQRPIKCRVPNIFEQENRGKLRDLHQKYLVFANKALPNMKEGSDTLNLESFIFQRKQDIQLLKSNEYQYSVSEYLDFYEYFARLSSGQASQPFISLKDYENWILCMEQLPELTDQVIDNLKVGIEQESVAPEVVVQRVISRLSQYQNLDVENSIFYRPVIELPKHLSTVNKQYIIQRYSKTIRKSVLTAYHKFFQFLKTTYLTSVQSSLEFSDTVYKNNFQRRLEAETSSKLPAEQLHQFAMDDMQRIRKTLFNLVANGEQLTFSQLKNYFTNSEQFLFSTEKEVIAAFNESSREINMLATQLTSLFPRSTYSIKVRPLSPNLPKVFYQTYEENGFPLGTIVINSNRLSELRRWEVFAHILREALPGRHLQNSLQDEFGELERFRYWQNNTPYIEGWGLYAESLGSELNLSSGEFDSIGFLIRNLTYSTLAVVDTGIHTKGWSIEKARHTLVEELALNEQQTEDVIAQVLTFPGRLSAVKAGELAFRSARKQAEETLGNKFSLMSFHSRVLRGGAQPLDVLQKDIDFWLSSNKHQ